MEEESSIRIAGQARRTTRPPDWAIPALAEGSGHARGLEELGQGFPIRFGGPFQQRTRMSGQGLPELPLGIGELPAVGSGPTEGHEKTPGQPPLLPLPG